MLQDNSEDHKQTWMFLERRIKDATQIHSVLTATSDMAIPEQALNRATEAASAAFTTVIISSFKYYSTPMVFLTINFVCFQARNILGLNWNR